MTAKRKEVVDSLTDNPLLCHKYTRYSINLLLYISHTPHKNNYGLYLSYTPYFKFNSLFLTYFFFHSNQFRGIRNIKFIL